MSDNTFQTKLDEILFKENEMTIRKFIKHIYNLAIEDRDKAKELFDKIFLKYQNENDSPEINFMPVVTKYMELMKQSNMQLIELAKIVEKIVNSNSNNQEEILSDFNKEILSEAEKLSIRNMEAL